MSKSKRVSLIAALSLTLFVHGASAGVYSDELTKCLVDSTTPADRITLVRWFFAAAAQHPDVKDLTSVKPAQLDEANKQVGKLFMRLLTESCKKQTQKANEVEGSSAMQVSFTVLGQMAGRELFSHPAVTTGVAGLEKEFDVEKLKSALAPDKN